MAIRVPRLGRRQGIPLGPAFPGASASAPGAVRDARAAVGHLAGLDGLRAIAVLAVVIYHAGLGWLPGGFLGVQVFFVISGYLITGLLLDEWERTGGIDLAAFWLRRARRLLPALFFLLATTLAVAVVVLPDEVARLRTDAAAAVGYVTNWYLVYGGQSYFESVGRPSLFLHLWSLAVEEQFYLVWPVALSIGLVLIRRRPMLVVTALAVVASTAWMAALFLPDVDPSRLYYGTDTRLAGLLVGAALAFVWVPRRAPIAAVPAGTDLRAGVWDSRRAAIVLDAAAVAGLALMAWFFVATDDLGAFLYQGGFTLLAVVTAVVIAGAVHPRGLVGRALDAGPMSWIGTRSYSIYLWYWPVFALTRPGLDVPLGPLALLPIRLAITALLAEVSYRAIETPVRRGALGRAWTSWREEARDRRWGHLRWPAPAAGALALAASAIVVSVAVATPPPVPGYLGTSSIDGVVTADGGMADGLPADGGMADAGAMGTDGTAVPEGRLRTAGAMATAGTAGPTALPSPAGAPTESTTDTVIGAPSGGARAADPGAAGPSASDFRAAPPDASGSDRSGAAPAAQSPTTVPPLPGILAIGDSVMIDAAPALARLLGPIDVDASVGRHIADGIALLRARAAAGTLPDTVIVDLGNNGPFYGSQFDQAMRALADVRTVVWVNLTVPRDWESWNNGVLAKSVPRYPNARLVDWHDASTGRPELFWADGFHPRPAGATLLASLVVAALGR